MSLKNNTKPICLEALIVVGAGPLFCIIDVLVDVFIFNEGTFAQQLFSPTKSELWMRSFVICLFFALGVYVCRTTRKLRTIQNEREEKESILRLITEGATITSGPDFPSSLVKSLSSALDVRFVFISEACDPSLERLRLLAYCEHDKLLDCFEYDITGAPCEKVIKNGSACYPEGIQDLFPDDGWLVKNSIVGYLAIALIDSTGKPIGHLGIAHDKPLKNCQSIESILKIFASRAGSELECRQTEEALRESEERYKTLVERNPHGIDVIDKTGIITYANPAFQEMVGYTKKELEGKHIVDLLEPASRRSELREYLSLLVKEQPAPTVYFQQNRRKDGKIIEQAVNWNYIWDDKGSVVGFISVITDITKHKKVQEEQIRLATAIEAAGEGIMITDSNGVIQYVNHAFEQNFLYDRQEVVGRKPDILKSGKHDQAFYKEMWNTILSGKNWHGTIINRKKDGTLCDTEETITSIRRLSGDIVNYVAVMKDITERKNMERDKLRLAKIVDSSNDGIISVDLNGNITSWNPGAEQIYGYKAEEVKGRSIRILAPPGQEKEARAMLERIIRGELIKPLDVKRKKKNGTLVDVSLTIFPIRDESGQLIGNSSISRNISERKTRQKKEKELQSQLVQADKLSAIGLLAAGVAHELNSPLTGILSLLRLYKKKAAEKSKEGLHFTKIIEASEHMADIIKSLNHFSKVSEEDFEDVNINEVIESTLSFSAHQLVYRNIEIKKVYGDDLPNIKGNKSHLQQVILNLLINARDSLGEKGWIEIRTKYDSKRKMIILEVADNGIGIRKEELTRIFDPFFTSKYRRKGTGLGLSVSLGIIKAHSGKILVESEYQKGTKFIIELPKALRSKTIKRKEGVLV